MQAYVEELCLSEAEEEEQEMAWTKEVGWTNRQTMSTTTTSVVEVDTPLQQLARLVRGEADPPPFPSVSASASSVPAVVTAAVTEEAAQEEEGEVAEKPQVRP